MMNCIRLSDLTPRQIVACLNAKGLTDSGDNDDNLMTLREFATENGWRKDEKSGDFLINPRGVNKFPYEDRQATSQDMTRTPESSDQIQSTRPVASAPNPPHTGTAISCPGLQSGLDAQQGILSSSHVPLATRVTQSTAAGPTASAFSAHEQQHPRSLSKARFETPDNCDS